MKSLDEKIILAAHRGDRKHAPENTMPAFEAAVKLGMDMIETDLHMSRDGVMFILHDDKLDRTTNGHGWTWEQDWAELSKLDAGSWFSPEFTGVHMPTLDEFCQLVAATPGLWVNWELKDYPRDSGEHAFRSADGLLDAIKKYHLEDRSMLNSFSTEILEYVCKKTNHSMPIHGQGVGDTCKMHGPVTMPIETYWDWSCVYADNGWVGNEKNYAQVKEKGIIPCVCIPDTVENYKFALDNGCRMFTSNDPEEAIKVMKALGVR